MTNPTLPEGAEQQAHDSPNLIVNADGESVAGPMPTLQAQPDYQALLRSIPTEEIGLYLSQDETARKSVLGVVENRPQIDPNSPAYQIAGSATGR
jgi:hypothetical protein